MPDVHIVAVGARTPVGATSASAAAAVRAGINRFQEHPFCTDRLAEPLRLAVDPSLPYDLAYLDRLTELVLGVLRQLSSEINKYIKPQRIPLYLVLPLLRPGWTPESICELRLRLIDNFFSLGFDLLEMLPTGHAGGLLALGKACAQIEKGQGDIYAIAGVDSYLEPKTINWLDDSRRLATSYNRSAFFPGEGAGGVAIASRTLVLQEHLDSKGSILGYGSAKEQNLMNSDSVCLGRGLTKSIRCALTQLKIRNMHIRQIFCDINGERYRNEEWGFALLEFPGILENPTAYSSPASCWGDVGAATGPLLVTLAVQASERGWSKGDVSLIWSGSENGNRGSVIIQHINKAISKRLWA